MALLNKRVLLGPIRNHGNREYKILMEFNGEWVVKRRRQFVLEKVVNWHMISAFKEEVAETLRNADGRAQIIKEEGDVNGYSDHDIIQAEQEGREDKEMIKVVDKELARRMIEILNAGITI